MHREYKESLAAEAALGEEDRYPVVVIDDANHGQADMSAMFDVVRNVELKNLSRQYYKQALHCFHMKL